MIDKDKKIRELSDKNRKLEQELVILKRRNIKEKEKHNEEDRELALALAKIEEMESRQIEDRLDMNSGSINSGSINSGINRNPPFHPSDIIDINLLSNDPSN